MQTFAEERWQKVGARCIAAGVGPGTSLRLASTTELHPLLFFFNVFALWWVSGRAPA